MLLPRGSRPGGDRVELSGVNYLALQGSEDHDVVDFAAKRQFQNIKLGEKNVKTAVYFKGGNHSFFNTKWGTYDIGYGLAKYQIDTGKLLDAPDQQTIALAYIDAFLDYTLNDSQKALDFLRSPDARKSTMPKTEYKVATESAQ